MENRTAGIVATVIAVFLCGCPGLFALCFGAIAVPVSFSPNAEIDIFGSSDPQSALTSGLVMLCLGLLFIAIPVIVGFLTLRNRPAASAVISAAPVRPPSPSAPLGQFTPTMEVPPVDPAYKAEPRYETDLPDDLEKDLFGDRAKTDDLDEDDQLPPAL